MSITSVRRFVGSGCFVSFFIIALTLCSIAGHAAELVSDPNSVTSGFAVASPVLQESVVIKTADGTWRELVGQRNSNTRVWEVTKGDKRLVVHEVGGGICYEDVAGKWCVSDTRWIATADGFVMDKAGYKLEIGKTAGSLMKYYVDGRKLEVRPSALLADDNSQAVNIAQLDAAVTGQIDTNNPNKLIFANAFGTGIDLEIEAKPGGYHQNVIFHQKPTLPKGLDSATTKIQLFTEMDLDAYEDSKPGNVGLQLGRLKKDDALNLNDPNTLSAESTFEEISVSQLSNTRRTRGNIRFVANDGTGNKRMSHFLGRSDIFTISSGTNGVEHKNIATAEKEFVRVSSQGKTFLVETLDASVLEQATYPVVWDYHSVSGSLDNDTTWKSDSTYYVSSDVTVALGKTLTIESGAVVKFGLYKKLSAGSGSIIAQGKPYLPIIFTSMNDNSIGDVIPESNGDPSIWDHSGIKIGSGSEFEFCVVRYASVALTIYDYPAEAIQNNVITGCGEGICADIDSYGLEPVWEDLYILNNLISNRGYSDAYAGISILSDIGTTSIPPSHCTTNVYNNTLEACDIGVYVCQSGYMNLVNIYDCLFVNCSSYGAWNDSSSSSIIAADHNAFFDVGTDYSGIYGGNNNLSPLSANPYYYDAITLEYTYYLDEDGDAVDAGSHDEGMPDFTTDADESLADTGQVDIGYHHSCQNPYSDAVTWYVDVAGDDNNGGSNTSPFKTIQHAIDITNYRSKGDAAIDNVIVKDGIYYENIQFDGLNVEVKSESGIANGVTIHGDGTSPVVSFEGTETSACKLMGVTVRSDDVDMPDSENLINRWVLDDLISATTADDIGYDPYNGALTNGAAFITDGCRGNVLSLDGINGYVTMSGHTGITGGAARTCSAWIKTGISDSSMAIVAWGELDQLGERWLFRVKNGYLNLKVGSGTTGGTFVADGNWHHVAVTLEDLDDNGVKISDARLYVDGKADKATIYTEVDISTTPDANVEIGSYNSGSYFNGSISDVRIYEDIALNAGQIRQMYLDTGAGAIAHWTFDSNMSDSTDYDRDGTEAGDAVVTPSDSALGAGSLSLDGDGDYIEIKEITGSTPAWTGISSKQARTCSAWINKGDQSTGKRAIASWGKTDLAGEKWLFLVANTGELSLKVEGGTVKGSTVLQENNWYHVAASVYDYSGDGEIELSEVKLYVDGVEQSCTVDVDVTVNTDTSSPNVHIGAHCNGTSCVQYFKGLIDDVRIYNRALSSVEIGKLAGGGGGGIYGAGTEATISNCIITKNTADNGGGIYNCAGMISDCVISDNTADFGGGMANFFCDAVVKQCDFIGNTARIGGGGIRNDKSALSLLNCVLSGNRAMYGGGVDNRNGSLSSSSIVNCTFNANRATLLGGGIFCGGYTDTDISNSILFNNSAAYGPQIGMEPSVTTSISYCDVESAQILVFDDGCTLTWGDYNFDNDPYFADAGSWDDNGTIDDERDDTWLNGDCHLMSVDGRWDTVVNAFVYDGMVSQCIASGDPGLDNTNEPLPNGGQINIGAYGNTGEASMISSSSFGTLQVTITPSPAATAGAMWRASCEPEGVWHASGTSISLVPGVWTVSYKAISQWQTPTDEAVQVAIGAQTIESGEYIYTNAKWVDGSNLNGPWEGTFANPYNTIQDGIDSVSPGGTIYVKHFSDVNREGYEENLTFSASHKSFNLIGTGASKPVIDGTSSGSVIEFNGTVNYILIDGFEIINGKAQKGGGIYIENSSPEICNCSFRDNQAYSSTSDACGGGICIWTGSPDVENCQFIQYNSASSDNNAGGYYGRGGAIYTRNCTATFVNCQIGVTPLYNSADFANCEEVQTWTDGGFVGVPTYECCFVRGQECTTSLPGTCASLGGSPNVYCGQ